MRYDEGQKKEKEREEIQYGTWRGEGAEINPGVEANFRGIREETTNGAEGKKERKSRVDSKEGKASSKEKEQSPSKVRPCVRQSEVGIINLLRKNRLYGPSVWPELELPSGSKD